VPLQIRQIHLAIFDNHTKLLKAIPQHKQIAKKEFHIYICRLTTDLSHGSLEPFLYTIDVHLLGKTPEARHIAMYV
jgi:hypothetical protein